jgi:hypothetical protein
MGLFLAMSGVANANRAAVAEALRAYAAEKKGTLETVGPATDLSDALLIADSGDHVTVMYPNDFMKWDEASAYLSKALDTSVFSLHIHDEDLWMYVFYSKGEPVDQFNPLPGYWSRNMPKSEKQVWAGNAAVVAQHWPGLAAESIRDYLYEWDRDEEDSDNAYDDDQFPYNDCWQVTDFMHRLGLVYPIDNEGNTNASTYRFAIPNPG